MTVPQTDEQREALGRAVADLTAAFQWLVDAIRPAVQAAAETITQAAQHLTETGLLDDNGRPARRDRPAWQSPYGPPARRTRRRP